MYRIISLPEDAASAFGQFMAAYESSEGSQFIHAFVTAKNAEEVGCFAISEGVDLLICDLAHLNSYDDLLSEGKHGLLKCVPLVLVCNVPFEMVKKRYGHELNIVECISGSDQYKPETFSRLLRSFDFAKREADKDGDPSVWPRHFQAGGLLVKLEDEMNKGCIRKDANLCRPSDVLKNLDKCKL